ncbi:MAG TPA: methyltransferase domain-containing protein [Acidobacteriaceae bacterium]|jgi:tRNA (cmo5U34)-methyltransferase|nr:methyltransferase domain-containing protein [Acidobacteriaceae bacterium]
MRENRTQAVFDATARTYDENRARLIPCYQRFYAAAVELIPEGTRHVVDLGAGTGLLSVWVRERLPEARLELIDSSGLMLEKARERFAGDARVSFELRDYARTAIPGCDAVVSALSIHHLEDEEKRALFGRAYEALAPGGVFINADQVLGPTAGLEEQYKQRWLAEVRELGATEQQVKDSLLRQEEDRCASVEDQVLWMREAGFADADCWFKDGRFAVMAGTRVPAS